MGWNRPKECTESAFFKACLEDSSEMIKNVLDNNRYLLKKAKISLAQQRKAFAIQGIHISPSFVMKLASGERWSCNTTWVMFFCRYWGISFAEMVGRNFRREAELGEFKL